MLEELQRRNFASSTIRYYIRTVRDFAAYFHKPPDQLGVEELRQFQLHLLRDQKLATGTVENRMTALHFFFKKVLKRYDPELYEVQLSRVPRKLPVVLSPEEVEKLIAAAPNNRYRMILLLLCHRSPAGRSLAVERRVPSPFPGTCSSSWPDPHSLLRLVGESTPWGSVSAVPNSVGGHASGGRISDRRTGGLALPSLPGNNAHHRVIYNAADSLRANLSGTSS
jgi:hypothetical protein